MRPNFISWMQRHPFNPPHPPPNTMPCPTPLEISAIVNLDIHTSKKWFKIAAVGRTSVYCADSRAPDLDVWPARVPGRQLNTLLTPAPSPYLNINMARHICHIKHTLKHFRQCISMATTTLCWGNIPCDWYAMWLDGGGSDDLITRAGQNGNTTTINITCHTVKFNTRNNHE